MKKLLLILLILVPAVLRSQNNEDLKDGFQQFRYPNGNLSSEGFIRNGKPDGYWKSYYVTGVLKSEGKRRSFLLDSIWVFFDQAGDTTEKISYLSIFFQLQEREKFFLPFRYLNLIGTFRENRLFQRPLFQQGFCRG